MNAHDRKIRALEALRTAGVSAGDLNHLVSDELSVNRARQVLTYLAEMHLQIGGEQCSEAANQDTHDWTEGLGWILLSCAEALEIYEANRTLESEREHQVRQLRGVAP